MTVSDQKQFTIPGRLLTPDGELSTAGWARQPILDCNLEDAHFYNLGLFQPMRIKRWDYYGITTPDHFFSFTLSDVGYLCMIFAYGIDFTTGKYHEETLTLPLGGHVQLPRNSTEGETSYSNGKVSMRFNVEPGARTLDERWPGFGGHAVDLAVVVKALFGDGDDDHHRGMPRGQVEEGLGAEFLAAKARPAHSHAAVVGGGAELQAHAAVVVHRFALLAAARQAHPARQGHREGLFVVAAAGKFDGVGKDGAEVTYVRDGE